eukprot:5631715-Amphidinium_carterae.1
MILSSTLSPGTGILAILARCHGAPGGSLDSRSASRGCAKSGSWIAGSFLAATGSTPSVPVSAVWVGAGQPSPRLTKRQRRLVAVRKHWWSTKAVR